MHEEMLDYLIYFEMATFALACFMPRRRRAILPADV